MISVEEALAAVLDHAKPAAPQQAALADSLGHVLCEDVRSDIDSPPHDKSLMDGYAVVAADIAEGVELLVIEEVMAGQTPSRSVGKGQATRIMTGAPIPSGADAVVVVEQTEAVADRVCIRSQKARAGQNIMPRGTSMLAGGVVLRAGQEVRPIEIGVLAEVGVSKAAVYRPPTVAVLSTGNELVAMDSRPAAGQIRNSNGPMLEALVRRAGGQPMNLGVGRDRRDELGRLVEQGLSADVLVLSGGVSAGVLDLVPAVLADNGVEQVFHKVSLKPGKPIWFGVKREADTTKLVFGLPGNPVSSLVCFELFVRPALRALAGHEKKSLPQRTARLTQEYQHRGDRPTYYPARLSESGPDLHVAPLAWKGSADLATLSQADCFAFFPPGDRTYRQDECVAVHLLP